MKSPLGVSDTAGAQTDTKPSAKYYGETPGVCLPQMRDPSGREIRHATINGGGGDRRRGGGRAPPAVPGLGIGGGGSGGGAAAAHALLGGVRRLLRLAGGGAPPQPPQGGAARRRHPPPQLRRGPAPLLPRPPHRPHPPGPLLQPPPTHRRLVTLAVTHTTITHSLLYRKDIFLLCPNCKS